MATAKGRLMRSRILFTLCFVSVLVGQPSFSENIVTTDAHGASAVYAIDMDNDGDIDMVSGGYTGGPCYNFGLYWYENNGSESFTKYNISYSCDMNAGAPMDVNSVYAIDVDSDGDMDVLSASGQDDKIAWYENNGSQSFTAHNITTSAYRASDVYAMDVDGDGDIDVLSADAQKIAWYENNGSESFTARTIATLSGGIAVKAIDLDTDGDIDVISGQNNSTGLIWYENNGSESFTAHTITASHATSVYAADMDNDGDIDVVRGDMNNSDGGVFWYNNNGSESFTEHTISTTYVYGESVYARDMDKDGDIDVLSAGRSVPPGHVAWYENNGSQSFTTHAITISHSPHEAYPIDVDSDGDVDVVAAIYVGDQAPSAADVVWYENTMDIGMIGSWTAADIATSADGATSVFTADMDNDGDMDIVSASYNDDAIAWYENDGAANPSWTAADIATSADQAYSVFAADMDNDGDMDIVSASYNDDAIAWYENDGAADPSWTAADIATSANGAIAVFAADMDNDGDMDIVSASMNDDAIAWYENDGAANPSWTAADIATNIDGAYSVYAADMDNDGDMDIISGAFTGKTIDWFENDGAADPSWTAANIKPEADGKRITSVYAADMDNDGDMDIVFASSNDVIAWYENDGAANPSWTAADIATSADGARSVFAADIDNDGDMDIVSASLNDDTIAWYENDGAANPSWTAADIATSADEAWSVVVADMDNDGDMDIVSASMGDDAIAWYENSYDAIVPTVSSVSSTNDNGTYKVGDVISITVAWSEAATVTGT
ncbi:VCBS repeat-containing protein, partial [Candidatus Marinimicrobia bacterium]|nr:VCBS repeat-containing protein [Candidatus Neomarinimicrobiota bacterium]